jgi:hypothetical protein
MVGLLHAGLMCGPEHVKEGSNIAVEMPRLCELSICS